MAFQTPRSCGSLSAQRPRHGSARTGLPRDVTNVPAMTLASHFAALNTTYLTLTPAGLSPTACRVEPQANYGLRLLGRWRGTRRRFKPFAP